MKKGRIKKLTNSMHATTNLLLFEGISSISGGNRST